VPTIAKIPIEYENWNRNLLAAPANDYIYTGKQLEKALEKIISKKTKETS